MGKRIMAIAVLIGFVLLMVNILLIGYQLQASLVIYGLIVAYYLFVMNRKKKEENQK